MSHCHGGLVSGLDKHLQQKLENAIKAAVEEVLVDANVIQEGNDPNIAIIVIGFNPDFIIGALPPEINAQNVSGLDKHLQRKLENAIKAAVEEVLVDADVVQEGNDPNIAIIVVGFNPDFIVGLLPPEINAQNGLS